MSGPSSHASTTSVSPRSTPRGSLARGGRDGGRATGELDGGRYGVCGRAEGADERAGGRPRRRITREGGVDRLSDDRPYRWQSRRQRGDGLVDQRAQRGQRVAAPEEALADEQLPADDGQRED